MGWCMQLTWRWQAARQRGWFSQAQPTSGLPPAEAIKRYRQHQPADLILLLQQVPDADAAS